MSIYGHMSVAWAYVCGQAHRQLQAGVLALLALLVGELNVLGGQAMMSSVMSMMSVSLFLV